MKILLPVDGSIFSDEAVRRVATEFRSSSPVRVLHVVEPVGPAYVSADLMPHLAAETPQIERDRRKQAQELVERVAARLRKAGFRASTAVEQGETRSVILRDAARWKADLIVMGSHGLKGMMHLLMGSVSESVARHAACSVQIVRLPPGKARR